jgi:hypothetical protein
MISLSRSLILFAMCALRTFSEKSSEAVIVAIVSPETEIGLQVPLWGRLEDVLGLPHVSDFWVRVSGSAASSPVFFLWYPDGSFMEGLSRRWICGWKLVYFAGSLVGFEGLVGCLRIG